MVKQIDYNALEEQRKLALSDGDSAAYAFLCDELGINEPEDLEAYEKGLVERTRQTPIEELDEGELERSVNESEFFIDKNKFGNVIRSYVAGTHLRNQGNIKTDDPVAYAKLISEAYLDYSLCHNGYGVKVDSDSVVSSGRRRKLHFSACFLEKMIGKGTYRTEYSTSFEEDHDDMDKTNASEYQIEHLNLLRELVLKNLPSNNVVVEGNSLYVF